MAFGLDFPNDLGHTVISEETYNPTFVGKATWLSSVSGESYMTVALRGISHAITEHKFRIACDSYPMPFIYVPQGYYFSLAGIESAGSGLWNIYVDIGIDSITPEVYVFASKPASISGGFGMALYDAGGAQVFHSDLRHLVIQQVVQPSVPNTCGRSVMSGGGGTMAVCTDYATTAIGTPPTKAAVFCPTHGAAMCPSHNSQLNSSECYTGGFMINGTTLTAAWNWATHVGGETDFVDTIGVRPMLIIDGALYD